MTLPEGFTRIPAYATPEPGAIVFLADEPWTEDDIYAQFSSSPPSDVPEDFVAAGRHAFHLPGQHDQASHGRGGVTGHDALDATKIKIGSDDGKVTGGYLRPEEAMALRRYRSTAYVRINRHMRGEAVSMDDVTDAGVLAASIKEAMARSPLQQTITVTRGTKNDDWLPEQFRGGQGDMTGATFRDRGFVSTSARTDQSRSFTRPGGVRLTITAPEGTGAIGLSDFTDEAEILLDAGLTFRVTRDHGLEEMFKGGAGVRHLEVEVVPA